MYVSARGVGLCALLAIVSGTASAKCTLHQLLELHVIPMELAPLVGAKVNGTDVSLLVDTGAVHSVLSPAIVSNLKSAPVQLPGSVTLEGAGGSTIAQGISARDFQIGNQTLHNVAFLVAYTGVDGLLGQDILRIADAEFDLRNGAVRLIRAEGCWSAPLAYWDTSREVGLLEIERTTDYAPEILGTALINGHRVKVLFDTGSGKSILSLKAAAEAGETPTSDGVVSGGPAEGVGGGTVATWIAPFSEFRLDNETIRNTKLRIGGGPDKGGLNLPFGAEMVLGADFFLSHHLFVSYQQKKIYFTYNGGPVFDLSIGPGRQVARSPGSPSSESSADGETPLDAAAYARRAEALFARRQYDAANADLAHAMRLAPSDPQYAYLAGRAHLIENKPAEALAEFDKAIQLKPDFIEALAARGKLLLDRGEVAAGRADLEAAIAHSRDETLALQLSVDCIDVGQQGVAIDLVNEWIARHPNHGSMPAALSNRCYARAAGGEQLDEALADCNVAIERVPGNHIALTRRGIVHLRRHELDQALADFDAALKKKPDYSMALYGRGLAELLEGRKQDGEADMLGAGAFSTEVKDSFRRMGLTPEQIGEVAPGRP